MPDINGKHYEIIEISARKFKEITKRLEKEFGKNWREEGGIDVGIIMLGACLKNGDGSFITEEELWDLGVKTINTLSKQALQMNGQAEDEPEKN